MSPRAFDESAGVARPGCLGFAVPFVSAPKKGWAVRLDDYSVSWRLRPTAGPAHLRLAPARADLPSPADLPAKARQAGAGFAKAGLRP